MANFWGMNFGGSGSDGYGLFSSTSQSSTANLLGDYMSIRNGSYRKLLKSYYGVNSNSNSNSSVSASSNVKDSKQTLNAVSDTASALKNSISKVKSLFETKKDSNGNTYTDYDTDKMYSALKDYVDNYNKAIDAGASSDTNSIYKSAQSMASYTARSKNALKEIGITVGADNKLSIDKEKFQSSATSKGAVESLFKSTGGYSYQINSKASNMVNVASSEAKKIKGYSISTKSANSSPFSIATSKDSTKTLGNIRDVADKAEKSLTALQKTGSGSLFNKKVQKKEDGTEYTDYDKKAIYSAVKDFVGNYNSLVDKVSDSQADNIKQAGRTLTNYAYSDRRAMEKVGITIDSNNNLSIDEEKFMKADMADVKSLFQGSNSFGRNAGIQIQKIDNYAEMEAAKSNTYNNSGAYSYNYNSGNWYASYM